MSLLRIIKAWVLLLLFVVYQVGTTGFVHEHIVNGVVVVHSHLSGNKEHGHTEKQVVSIDCLCHYVCSDLPEVLTITAPNVTLGVKEYAVTLVEEVTSEVLTFCLRGPPAKC